MVFDHGCKSKEFKVRTAKKCHASEPQKVRLQSLMDNIRAGGRWLRRRSVEQIGVSERFITE